MRNVVYAVGASLDQFIAREDGSVDWLSMEWEYDWTAFFKRIDVVLMGRRSWDRALEMGGNKNPYPGVETYVFSKTINDTGIPGVKLVSGGLAEFVAELKAESGKDIWLCGGGDLAASFFDLGLIDEISVGITPVLLGRGIPLVSELNKDVALRLVSCEEYPHKTDKNAMIELRYEIVR